MISLGSRDGRKVLEQGFSSNKREMNENELEEGEACSYQDVDTSIDPDVALSYIDEKLQNLLGHVMKDFEGAVSAESLGAKFGIYGSFLPAHRRSPIWSQSKSPPRVQNHIAQSPNTLQAEVGHYNTLAPASLPCSIKQGSASAGSASSYVYKPPPQNDMCRQNARTNSIQSLEECTPKSVVHDQKTLKVRIKVGSDNMSVKKNAAIYNGLGLDGSPTSSHDDSPLETEGLSCRLSFDSFESPTRILQMMTSSPLFGGCILSPLPDYLICLSERPKHLQEILTQPSSKAQPENSIIGHPLSSVKDKKTISDKNSMRSLDRKGLQDKKDEMDSNIGFDFQSKETGIEAITCEQLVSNALKLPLLSNAHDNIRESPEKGFNDASKSEPFDPISVPVSLSEKPHGKAISAGIVSHNEAEVQNDSVTNLEKVGNGKSETADKTTKFGTGWSKYKKASKIGLKYPGNQDTDKSTFCGDSMVLTSGKEPFSLGDEKIPKKSQVHDSSRKVALEINKDSAQVLKDGKSTDAENNAYRIQVQKDSSKARGQYADFFGEINEQDDDIMNSPDVPSGEMLKTSEEVDKTTLTYENTSRERTSSMETCKGTTSGAKSRGYSNNASVPENGQPIPEPPPINWVGCDKCQKWRIIPPGAKSDNLPDKWDCSLMTWLLPNKNRCSTSEEETNGDIHAPPPGMTSADYLSSAVAINGKPTGKVRKTSKSTFQNSPKKLASSVKKKQQSEKEKTSKETKDSCLVNGRDFQQHPKSGDTYSETDQHKKMEKHKTDYYSDGGYAKIPNSKRGPEQEFSKASKKSKTWSKQTGDTDKEAAHNQGAEILGVSSGYGLAAGAAGKNRVSNSEVFASQNTKDDMDGIPPDSLGKSNAQSDALPAVVSVHVSKSGSKSKKRKGDNFEDPPSSTPSSGKLMDDHESRKRHRISKSEGKDSSVSRRNGKADKKSRSVSQHRLNSKESVQKDSLCVNPVVAATSSSSKVSGSLKVKSKLQEVKGSPVESVSSSPMRISNSDKLASGCKVIMMNDNVPGAVKLATRSPARCSASDYEGSGDQFGSLRKDIVATATHHGSPNYSKIDVQDKSRGGLQLTNGNGCIDNLDLDNACPSEAQASHRSVNETAKIDIQLDTNMSNSEKSWKGSPSISKEKDQTLKSNSGKGKGKVSEYDNSLDHIYEERARDRKIKFDNKCGSIADKTDICSKFPNKEPSLPKSEDREEFDKKRSSRKFDVEKTEDLVPVSAKEKSRHVPRSDDEKNETLNIIEPRQVNKASTSANDARPDGLPREPRLNKKADNQNGTHTPCKHPIPNGNRIKNHDAPSPLRRDSSSQAASSAIKEATNLKHLADRLKNSGSTESTGMYFEAALKFLHGASLLESGKTENIKHADIAQSMQIYSSTAKLCQFCAYEFEKSKDMATAALAYKCVEVAYLRVIYSSHNSASRDRNVLQTALQMVPPGESPSSSASDIDNLNNTANGDKAAQSRSGGSPQLASNLVIAGRNPPNFSRLLKFAQDVNSAMEASRKSRVAFAAASGSIKDGITPIKRALDFNFHDVDGLLRLVRLAKEAISR